MIYFLDASAVVKKYIAEAGSDRFRALVRARRSFAVSRLSSVEVPAALARRAREGDLSREIAQRHATQYAEDVAQMRIVELRAPVLELAEQLVWTHALRAYDAVQLGAALHLRRASGSSVTFVAADGPLCDAAEAQQLKLERLG